MMLRTIVAALLLSAAAASAQNLPDPVPAFDPAQQTVPFLPDEPCVCTMEYNPICGRPDGGERKTYPNECHAVCEKAEIVALGPC